MRPRPKVKRIKNLSHSRVNGVVNGCPTKLGYESIYEGSGREAEPYWLAGGGAQHYAVEQILKSTVAKRQPLDPKLVDQKLDRWLKHVWAVLMSYRPSRQFSGKINRIMWIPDEEREGLDDKAYQKVVQARMYPYLAKARAGLKSVLLQCTLPSPFLKTGVEVKLDKLLYLDSPTKQGLKIPVFGSIDRVDKRTDKRFIVSDYKSGNFRHYLREQLMANGQLLIYHAAMKFVWNREPVAHYLISLNPSSADLARFGSATLDQPQYKLLAEIRFEDQFPELVRLYDDVWQMIRLLGSEPASREEKKLHQSWVPTSQIGLRAGLHNHVRQGRLIPNISRQCDFCPAKARCQQDNAQDWLEYRDRMRLGNIAEPMPKLSEEFLDPFEELRFARDIFSDLKDEENFRVQVEMFARSRSPLRNYRLKARDWEDMGFFTPKKIKAILSRVPALIPVYNSEPCPCKSTGRVPPFLASKFLELYFEREDFKKVQEAQGKKRSGVGEDRVKELFNSEVVNGLLSQCPIEDCPFAKEKKFKVG